MLRKLIKHEFKNTCKIMLAIYAFIGVVTIFGIITFTLVDSFPDSSLLNYMNAAMLVLYFLSIFALFIATYIYMCVHFYKTMYSEQGYLTHTLPVSPLANLHVKIGVSFFWMITSCFVMLLSLFLLLLGITQGKLMYIFTPEKIAMLNEMLSESGLTLTAGSMGGYIIICTLISCLSYLLIVFASISIGQLFNQNKIRFSIIVGIAIYFIEQFIGTISISIDMIPSADDILSAEPEFTSSFINHTMISSLLVSLLFSIVLYTICNVIVRKHINLE